MKMIDPFEIVEKLKQLGESLLVKAEACRSETSVEIDLGKILGFEEAAGDIEEFIAVEIISKYGG